MLFVFANGCLVVVAGKTIPLDFGMIDVNIAEFHIGMAIRAQVAGRWMFSRLGFRHVTIVATKTRGRHTFENGAFVAFLARYLNMRSNKRKRCELVIEVQVYF